MKKLLAFLLAMIMVLSLCACDQSKKDKDDDETSESSDSNGNKDFEIGGKDFLNDLFGTAQEQLFKNVTADMIITAEGEQIPALLKCDLESGNTIVTIDMDEQTGIIALDNEAMYIITEQNGRVVNAEVQKLQDLLAQTYPQNNMPELTEEQLQKLTSALESVANMLAGKRAFDIDVITDLVNELGVGAQLDDLYAQIGLSAEQAEKVIQAVITLLNDEQWLKNSFNLKNTVINGTGSFSMNVDISKVAYDVVAAIAKELGNDVPDYGSSGMISMPLKVEGELKDGIPTKLNATFEYMGEKIELTFTNKITDTAIDLDLTLTAAGQSVKFELDGAAVGDSFSLVANLSAAGQSYTLLDLNGAITDSKATLNLTAGIPGDKLVIALTSDIVNGIPSTLNLDAELRGEKFSIKADLYDYDKTVIDMNDIKSKAEAAADQIGI